MKQNRLQNNIKLVYQVESDLHAVKMASLVYRSWIIDLYEEYCTALFYIKFKECEKDFYSSLMNDFKDVLSKLIGLVWESIVANSINPPPIDFDMEPVFIQDGKNSSPIEDFKRNK